jgi:hypothetical protein
MLICGTCGRDNFKSVGGLFRHYLYKHKRSASESINFIIMNNPSLSNKHCQTCNNISELLNELGGISELENYTCVCNECGEEHKGGTLE